MLVLTTFALIEGQDCLSIDLVMSLAEYIIKTNPKIRKQMATGKIHTL
jgi:hypothetical protein